MSIEQFLVEYGYFAVAGGCYLEGETVLMLGGMAAQQGALNLPLVMVAGGLGAMFGDQLYFNLGRRYGMPLLARRPVWRAKAATLEGWLGRHRDLFTFGFRFLYGLRVVSPLLVGVSGTSAARFTALNTAAVILWSVTIGLLGYSCGHGVEVGTELIQNYQRGALAVAGALVVVAVVWRLLWKRRASRSQPRVSAS